VIKKNLFYFDRNNSSDEGGSQIGITCEPCSTECKKIKNRMNNRKLSDIKDEEVVSILSPFKY